jgi:dynamin 1-like protein
MSGNLSSASTAGGRAAKEQQQHRSHHRNGSHSTHTNTNPGQAGAGAAKETFLNYFFGTQGPASGPSAAIPSSGIRSQNTHTDILGDEPLPEQDMGKVAAFDMKSLGKHIESVSNNRFKEGSI